MAYPYNSYQAPYYYPMYQQQPVQQAIPQAQVMQQNIQAMPSQQISNVWIYDASEIPNYPVAPNNAVRFWIANKQVFYEKSADATGKPTLKVYDYSERAETASDGVPASGDKLPTYATKDELSAVVGAVRGLDELLGSIKSDIDTMKTDMYGAVGKRRVSKKAVEVAEDDE